MTPARFAGRRPFRAPWPVAAALVLAAAAPWAARAGEVGVRSAVEFRRYDFDTWRGRVRIEQTSVPIDLLYRPSPGWRLRLGADWASSERSGLSTRETLASPVVARFGADVALLGGRVRWGAGLRLPASDHGLGPGDDRLAEALEAVALDLPLSRLGAGTRTSTQLAAQVVDLGWLDAQIGLGFERRGAYRLLDDGTDHDPADVWRIAASTRAAAGSWTHEFAAAAGLPGAARVAATRFDPGDEIRLEVRSARTVRRGRVAVESAFLARAGAPVDPGAPLRAPALRGGNAVGIRLTAARRFGRWEGEGTLETGGVRGFSGDLGHARWVAPGAGISLDLGRGRVRLGLRATTGEARSGRDLTGVVASLGWSGRLAS